MTATEGNDGIVVSSLLRDTGLVTVDPGFMNTASCESKVTYIDGDEGILRYRGYPIEQLAEKSTFLEVAYLLIHGELPTPAELDAFVERVNRHTIVHEDFRTFMGTFPRNAHPMAVMSSAINALAAFYPESLDPFDPETVELATVLILAKTRTITSYVHRASKGEPLLYPDYSRGYVEDFLRMTFAVPYQQYEADPKVVAAMDQLLILHADHEQNCSTSTVRIVGSSHANLYASVAAGINALSGPLHGGANEAVLKMLTEIQANGGDATEFMKRVKDKEPGVRLMGFGHRVYKNYDPRAAIVKKSADSVLAALGRQRRAARPGDGPRGDRAVRRVLHLAQALPERRLLHGPHLQGDGLLRGDVHAPVRARPDARLDRPVARDDGRPADEDRPSAPDLHGCRRARLRGHRRPADLRVGRYDVAIVRLTVPAGTGRRRGVHVPVARSQVWSPTLTDVRPSGCATATAHCASAQSRCPRRRPT